MQFKNRLMQRTCPLLAGNRDIHAITKTGKYELLVELEDFQQHKKHARYSSFYVADAAAKYRLSVDGYNGTAGKYSNTFACT